MKSNRKPLYTNSVTRRNFLAAGAAAAATVTIVPGRALGLDGGPPASEKLNIAGIGIGGMGAGNVRNCAKAGNNIVALCDCDYAYAGRVFKAYPDAKQYKDYRIMFDKQKDIDAVVIATPDHTHAVITMAAMQLGKHVFCQKPLTHTLYEARKIADFARANPKIMTQMGNQGHSAEHIRMVKEWIMSGNIGDVKEVHAWTDRPIGDRPWSNFAVKELPTEFPPVPDTLDWDLWLGPAKDRKYHPAYVPLKWRGWIDYGTGSLGDMGCHILDPACWALDLKHPTSITAEVEHHHPSLKDEVFPISAKVTFEFPQRGDLCPLKLVWTDGNFEAPRPKMLEEGRTLPQSGAIIFGDKETILHGSHGASSARIIPEVRMQSFELPEKTLPRVQEGHVGDWLRACKDGVQPSSNFADYGGQLTELALLGMAAQRVPGEKLQWDGKALEFTNNDEANRYVHTKYRDGWSLEG
jgi:predicted dehydrogenase